MIRDVCQRRGLRAGTAGLLLVAGTLLGGCSSSPPTISDSAPASPVDVSNIPDAVPRVEPITKAGNKTPYTVLGKTYRVMANPAGFQEEGIASWYGQKFHGRYTSNGEIYDMYGMTAAHKTLPIPCYVRVTNKANGRSAIVRVNDRGPFHDGRVIDLTYSGAVKLGFLQTGTAPVKIELIDPTQPYYLAAANQEAKAVPAPVNSGLTVVSDEVSKPVAAVAAPVQITPPSAPVASRAGADAAMPAQTYLQAGAFSTPTAASSVSQHIAKLTNYPVKVSQKAGGEAIYRVRIGPIAQSWELTQLREILQKNQLPMPYVVYE